ncbi:biotin--[acetyl-CoA-carboxylase] ligase [Litoribacter ruber]|uniref:biotin--[acetyl-CoA-carboxylase] ligase n=1 Tax=Litoribacter ruber TaxID=702568 RepID=UPI001BDA5867|nr:biotin--[acetyl-CoA-carboxylase] ligase [Litoribacter ruber]MBT0810783.1 biotin--[acetyl-CoA-carboxylase] ligase [Litoribacter ruber]
MHKILANTIFLGKDIHYLPECHSTNDEAMQLYKQGKAREGSIIITDKQTKGRGQRGNQWFSEPSKNLTFTLVLSPSFLDASQQFDLNIMITLAVQEVLAQYTPDIQVKWPNDIMHRYEGKLGGVLIENSVSTRGIDMSLVGIGLNLNQTDFAFPGPTSLAKLTGSQVEVWEILRLIVKTVENYYLRLKRGEVELLRRLFIQNLYRYNEWSAYRDPMDGEFLGKITGITTEGKLKIEKESGQLNQYAFKEVEFL